MDNDINNYTQILYKKDLGEEFFNKLCEFYKEGLRETGELDLEGFEEVLENFYSKDFLIEQINEDLEMILIRCYFN